MKKCRSREGGLAALAGTLLLVILSTTPQPAEATPPLPLRLWRLAVRLDRATLPHLSLLPETHIAIARNLVLPPFSAYHNGTLRNRTNGYLGLPMSPTRTADAATPINLQHHAGRMLRLLLVLDANLLDEVGLVGGAVNGADIDALHDGMVRSLIALAANPKTPVATRRTIDRTLKTLELTADGTLPFPITPQGRSFEAVAVLHDLKTTLQVLLNRVDLIREYYPDLPANDLDTPLRQAVAELCRRTKAIRWEQLENDLQKLSAWTLHESNLVDLFDKLAQVPPMPGPAENQHLAILRFTLSYLLDLFRLVAREEVKLAFSTVEEVLAQVTGSLRAAHPEVVMRFDPAAGERRRALMRLRTIRIFHNLLSNALEAGATEIAITTAISPHHLTVRVIDNAGGIPAHLRDTLFDQGTSSHPAAARGYGLAICRAIVDKLGGTIDLQVDEGVGTQFVVRLPYQGPFESTTHEKRVALETAGYSDGQIDTILSGDDARQPPY